ncbi:unnamed protein product [Candidula unifasciata]|uniref:Uncharacterized protein n=1 Tax=Candidula unifasciata TaxID=100452 RepID=A0A8S4A507_9EUPU|nr:unnamed protein product [Candidula unifasciata]
MPSASPLYTYSSVFSEGETPHVLSHSANSEGIASTNFNDNSNDNSSSDIHSIHVKNDNLSRNKIYSATPSSSSYTYDPFKCLSAMAEQSLTGNFTHSSSSADSSFFSGRGISSVSSRYNHDIQNSSNTFLNLEHSVQYPPCDDVYLSSSATSLSSTSPPMSPTSSHYTYMSSRNLTTTTDFFNREDSGYQKVSTLSTESQSRELIRSDQFDLCSATNQNSAGEVIGCTKTISKKSYPSCSSEHSLDESDKLLSWTLQHPEGWTNTEVLDWVFFVAQERGLDMQEFRGENFQAFTGAQLCQMGPEDFTRLEPKFGKIIYGMLRKLLSGVVFRKPMDPDSVSTSCVQMSSFSSGLSAKMSMNLERFSQSPHAVAAVESHECGGMTQNTFFKQERCTDMDSDGIDITSYDFDLNDTPSCFTTSQTQDQFQQDYGTYHGQYSQTAAVRTSCCFSAASFPGQLPRRRPGRPRVKSFLDDDRMSKEKRVKNQHLWEFIYETLMNPMYNPQYLRWENQRDGVFRFVQSEAVAQLWGGRKNNENMTYEKLSRAMRHYYRRGILERVEGRRLVYKFSIKAMERIRDKRNAV